jgi:colicin import membrane protein
MDTLDSPSQQLGKAKVEAAEARMAVAEAWARADKARVALTNVEARAKDAEAKAAAADKRVRQLKLEIEAAKAPVTSSAPTTLGALASLGSNLISRIFSSASSRAVAAAKAQVAEVLALKNVEVPAAKAKAKAKLQDMKWSLAIHETGIPHGSFGIAEAQIEAQLANLQEEYPALWEWEELQRLEKDLALETGLNGYLSKELVAVRERIGERQRVDRERIEAHNAAIEERQRADPARPM